MHNKGVEFDIETFDTSGFLPSTFVEPFHEGEICIFAAVETVN